MYEAYEPYLHLGLNSSNCTFVGFCQVYLGGTILTIYYLPTSVYT